MDKKTLQKITIYLVFGLIVLVIESIFIAWLYEIFGDDNYYLFGLPFSPSVFYFGLSLLIVPILVYLINKKLSKKINNARKFC